MSNVVRLAAMVLVAVLGACARNQPAPAPGAAPSPASSAPPSVSVTQAAPPTAATGSARTAQPAAIPASLRGKDLTRIPTTRKIVALTFDAGGNADGLASILGTLEREQVPATFFLTGDFARHHPEAARSMRGYRLGNHTMTHPHLPALNDAELRGEVLDAQEAIVSATGTDPRPWFRFPFGDRSTSTIEKINALGYVAVRWTVDSLGWQGLGKHTAASVAARVLDAATPGQIVLMHAGSNPDDGSTLDADALPAIIDGLQARGYSFVTLDALLAP